MTTYYNENDPKAAAWLAELMQAGHIPAGEIDTRSIADVRPADLAGFDQCHFFAGIGGWVYALALAGWPEDRPVWTGSCPCQPFSIAGQGRGAEDERHLWPVWRGLLAECRPPVVFGEQVASPDGRNWLAAVRAEMEALEYAVGAADLCAAGVGAPHIRQRLFFGACRLADLALTGSQGRIERGDGDSADQRDSGARGVAGGVADGERHGQHGGGCQRQAGRPQSANRGGGNRRGQAHGGWTDADWLHCRDGKWRPVEPGSFPLVAGLPGRVGLLRGYGNAIVPQVAAEFVMAFDEARS